jgi:mono/diheme cytochrome c family protein
MPRLALALASAALLAAAGCTDQAKPAAGPSGLSIFHTRCSRCHGADGAGSAVFNTPVLPVSRLSVEEMVQVITRGRNKMPAFSLQLTPEEITAVAGYVKNELGK